MATNKSVDRSKMVPCKETDFLDEDLAIRGQNYVCLSFLSPEEVIRDKNSYLFTKFCGDVAKDVTELFDSLNTKFAEDQATVDMIKVLNDKYSFLRDDEMMHLQYDTYLAAHPELEDDYHREHGFQTSVRGIKVRGTYDTLPEAENRVKAIQRFDDRFHVYVAAVGCWCPWSPNPEHIKDNVYAETQLNTLMKGYKENADHRDELHAMRKELFMGSTEQPHPERDQAEPQPQPETEPEIEPEIEAETKTTIHELD